jgi:RsiW-degrading membrane proteinase PrsW (M82 family)
MTGSHLPDWAALLIGGAVIAVFYFIPAFVARERGVPDQGMIIVVNVLLGWTVIGWVIALAMALRDPAPRADATPAGKWPWWRYWW